MAYLKTELVTTVQGVFSSSLALTDETLITLDVKLKSGTHHNSRITLQHSPDGIEWFEALHSTNGTGTVTATMATSYVRGCVLKAEGGDHTSIANIFITAK